MLFKIDCLKPVFQDNEQEDTSDFEETSLYYDNHTSQIYDHDMKEIQFENKREVEYRGRVVPISFDNPGIKRNIKRIKIQLGLSCNYSCPYCSQRFVPHENQANLKLVDNFLAKIDTWVFGEPAQIELWGGEPFVYWKMIKPLAEALRKKYPNAQFLIITNGSLLTDEIVDWIIEQNIGIGLSHDGPGQHVRGPDPLDDPELKAKIFKLFKRFNTDLNSGLSFNTTMNAKNLDRKDVQDFFENLVQGQFVYSIGEGGIIDVYDPGSMELTLTGNDHYKIRNSTHQYLRDGLLNRFKNTKDRIDEWTQSILTNRPSHVLHQKCGMDSESDIAVDLMGNVLTCQNVSSISKDDDGTSHKIGHISNLEGIRLKTATHWKNREVCDNCPLVQACKGACMFLKGDKFSASCDNAYSDHLPYFATAIEMLTGAIPIKIQTVSDDFKLPKDRENLWEVVR